MTSEDEITEARDAIARYRDGRTRPAEMPAEEWDMEAVRWMLKHIDYFDGIFPALEEVQMRHGMPALLRVIAAGLEAA